MASGSTSDVIELVSSDEETEPAPKKIKPGKNAMVHIPDGVTIKSSKTKPTPPIIREVVRRGVTLTKVDKLVQKPNANTNKPNGRQVQIPIVIRPKFISKPLPNPVPVQGVNPLSLMKKLRNSQIMINKVTANKNVLKPPMKKVAQKPIQKATVNTLPPSITVTRTSGGLKRPIIANVSNFQKKKLKVNPKPNVAQGEILTVELDDDEVAASSTANPQWYLRPEQQPETILELKNNTEPEPSNLIEITIDDSPVKPALSKQTCDVGTTLAITVEDSPAKPVPHKTASVGSDSEHTTRNDVPSSKKKLEYPNENVIEFRGDTIEIEIEPIEVTNSIKENDKKVNEEIVKTVCETIEIEESPLKKIDVQQASTPKKSEVIRCQPKSIDIEETTQRVEEDGEFHPVYQNFIDLCLKLEYSDDMKKIVDKKIKAYYRQVPKEYTESENFIDMVSNKMISMKAGPEKMYLYIKDIVDELNLQRKMVKSQVTSETRNTEPEAFLYGEDSEFDSKRQRQIRKLEKTLKKLHRAIQKLEEQEVDFDDEEDSVYLLTERYKERMVRVHAKFCQLTNTKMPSEPRVQIDARPGQPKGAAKRLEKWINRKVPIGTLLPFPDFHDVLRCVREANEEDKIGWNEADIMEEARDLFTRCGKKLQRRRQENEWRLAASRISQDIDPADGNESLKKRLEENKLLANKMETEVFNKYADRQNQLKLEAQEIGDKEAEESPVESEDEEPNEENLQNKEKRKERLRRLIQEKSKKPVDGKVETEEPEKIQSDNEMVLDGDNKTESNENESEKKEVESQHKAIDTANAVSNENDFKPKTFEKVHSISDDSNQVDSDIDELHLLQKLHSENDANTSTVDSSDTDTPIDISDTLHSSSDNKGKATSGVISIENSSYSESEVIEDQINSKDDVIDCHATGHGSELAEKSADPDLEIEFEPMDNVEMKTAQTNNDEYTDSVGNILLASSEDEDNECKDESPRSDSMCINLKDDTISIGDTKIQDDNLEKDKMNTKNKQSQSSGSVDVGANSKDSNTTLSIGDTAIQKHDRKTDKMDTKINEAVDVQNKTTSSVDISVNPVNPALPIGDTKTQKVEFKKHRIDTENNDETSSVVNTKDDETKSIEINSTKKDSVASIKTADALNIQKPEETKDFEVKDVHMSINSPVSLPGERNASREVQESCSPKITETVTSVAEKLVEEKLEEAKSTKNKDSLDTSTLSSDISKSRPGDETDLVEPVSRGMINPDESNKSLETIKNDVINNSIESVADVVKNATSDKIDDLLTLDSRNSVDQSDSLEKVLEDLQSNLQSNEPSAIVESVKNTA